MSLWEFIAIDLPPLLTAILTSCACGLVGNYLILRRQSLMGDAIAHSVLPGIVIAFLLTSHRDSTTIFIGAALSGLLSAFSIELLRRARLVESSAAIGIVFPLFFALGVLLIEQAAARRVDLDADCLLHGQLESLFWIPPTDMSQWLHLSTLRLLPEELFAAFLCFLVVAAFVIAMRKELTLSSFDPALANSIGFSSSLLNNLLMLVLSVAVVASFKAVGSILVIAMIICPAACARLFTDTMKTQQMMSLLFALLMTVSGYFVAVFLPMLYGIHQSMNAAGMIATLGGGFLILSIIFSPRHGALSRAYRRSRLQKRMLREDILALLFRLEEDSTTQERRFDESLLEERLRPSPLLTASDRRNQMNTIINDLRGRDWVVRNKSTLGLTEQGRAEARKLIRTHRLLEKYFVEKVGVEPDHVHETAETLEHFTSEIQEKNLAATTPEPTQDPHGKSIPRPIEDAQDD